MLACRLLCQQKISRIHLDLADALLMEFCMRAERIPYNRFFMRVFYLRVLCESCSRRIKILRILCAR